MDNEESRLRTFSEWPSGAPMGAAVAARSGFYSTGRGLEVQCWRCGGRISEWTTDEVEDVGELHRQLDPSCPYVREPPPPPSDSSATPPPAAAPTSASPVLLDDTNDTIYKIDVLRLISFTDWPVSYISRESLAAAGFYYMRDNQGGDRVRCAWCGGELMNWARGDNPLVEHLRHFPQCQYAKAKQRGYNNSNSGGSSVQNTSVVRSNEALLEGDVEGVVLGVGGAAESGMANREVRERSFASRWPSHLHQKPEDLAAAGFYYVGPDDQVRCFQCGGGLKAWETGDDPWIEHTRWFPSCRYLALAGDKQRWVEACMGQPPALQALACGLQPHTLRKAITNRLRTSGTPFPDTESLIDAALNEQLNEQSFTPPDTTAPIPPAPTPTPVIYTNYAGSDSGSEVRSEGKEKSKEKVEEKEVPPLEGEAHNLEEENRRLKEARMCKVCMDAEVGIVFLPCGHLVSCIQCAPCLTACPLCRAPIKGVVRTYLS